MFEAARLLRQLRGSALDGLIGIRSDSFGIVCDEVLAHPLRPALFPPGAARSCASALPG